MQILMLLWWLANETLTIAAIGFDNCWVIVLGPSNGVSSSDGPASIGMSSILCISANVARRLHVAAVRGVVELSALVDVLVCLLVLRQWQTRCLVCFIGVAAAFIITSMALVVQGKRPV